MKNKVLFSLPFLLLGVSALRAQSEPTVLYEAKLETKMVPTVIVDQIKNDFPGFVINETYLIPAKLYQQKWVVVEKNEMTNPADIYEVHMSGKNMNFDAVYSAKGVLLHSREIQKDVALPAAVSRTLSEHFANWNESRDREVIKNGKKEITHYIVFLKKGHREQRVVLSPEGKVLHRFEL